jgi:hypothetical protein
MQFRTIVSYPLISLHIAQKVREKYEIHATLSDQCDTVLGNRPLLASERMGIDYSDGKSNRRHDNLLPSNS